MSIVSNDQPIITIAAMVQQKRCINCIMHACNYQIANTSSSEATPYKIYTGDMPSVNHILHSTKDRRSALPV